MKIDNILRRELYMSPQTLVLKLGLTRLNFTMTNVLMGRRDRP